MKRKIIKIDEDKCTGCGECIPNCPEGALKIDGGKARVAEEFLCDGLGACIGTCPEGAITIEEREAQEYDEKKVVQNVIKAGGDVLKAHLDHLEEHGEEEYLKIAHEYISENSATVPVGEDAKKPMACGCPGSMMRDFSPAKKDAGCPVPPTATVSELGQWPIQLHLLNPHAPYFSDADILIAADCVPFSYPNFHDRFLKGTRVAIFCPKLDEGLDEYEEKLTSIFRDNNIRSITLVHMEVPCCFGLVRVVEEALKKSGKNITIKEYTISVQGEIV